MEYCTNCGAAARKGAKFCTSCGVRLESGVTATEVPPDDTQETTTLYTANPETTTVPEDAMVDEPAGTGTVAGAPATGAPETVDAISYEESWPDADEAPVPVADAPADTAAAGWPAPDATDAPDETVATGANDASLASWGMADTAPSPEPNIDEDPAGWETAGEQPEQQQAHPDHDHGPSEWEGWSPTPSPESAVHHHDDSDLREIRELVGTLQQRLDRLTDPAPVSARGVDADELADQLNGWASEGPDSEALLAVIREARANPRDIDAVTRLADRADELERLVERYGTICTDAQRWVARLRQADGQVEA